MQKKLQKNSKYAKYDLNKDGQVDDEELESIQLLEKLENDLQKQDAQRKMALASLVGMGIFTVAMFFVDIERVKAMAGISDLFYLSTAGIIGTYFGSSAFMSKKS